MLICPWHEMNSLWQIATATKRLIECGGIWLLRWPKVLLAAKTYANDPLKPALTVGYFKPGRPSSEFASPVQFAFPPLTPIEKLPLSSPSSASIRSANPCRFR